ncbi:MAG: undecaprenyl/decaprenyl-phosphate alpha-N-acetylglucosaminyl 1-phosphate transferase [Marinilabiliaceae bacterium]|nr:undecaprenyl/decaprenyl-phosphate alpha-N-acetylglucosaminyl 1-phosphate transferase [Marinilabiliaceae bacterium]
MNPYIIKLLIPITFIISFIIVFFSIPTILRVAHSKNLFDEPNKRSIHKTRVPTLGGLAIFIGFMFTYSLFIDIFEFTQIPYLISALLIIFGIGIKDDILVTAPLVKLIGQIIAAFIIVGPGEIRITDFQGFFGLQPTEMGSVIFSMIFVVFIINGFNLIDGVDGLAALTGVITIFSFSIWFYINDSFHIPILCATLSGGLLAFSYFNVFSANQKIFMGDTGSLMIGLLMAVVSIKFIEFNKPINHSALTHTMMSAPSVAAGILIVPIIDTLRVFFLRLSKGLSPFTADKNHIHHRLLTLGFSHLQISAIIGGVNIFFVLLSYYLRNLGTLKLMLLLLLLGILVSYFPSWAIIYKMKKINKQKRKRQKV